jgi:hypothetical protein
MVKVDDIGLPLLTKAVDVWTGFSTEISLLRDKAELFKRCGPELGSELLIKRLYGDFCSTDARYTSSSLAEMGEVAIRDFKRKHPELPEEIAKAFAWWDTFVRRGAPFS